MYVKINIIILNQGVDILKKQSKKKLTTLSIIISALVLGLGVFYGTYYFFISKSYSTYEDTVFQEIANITKVNENCTNFIKGETINKDKILTSLPESISSLQDSLSKLRNLVVTDKYQSDHNDLIKGLENNISIYKQIFATSSDLKSANLEKYIPQLQKYRDDSMNYYTLVTINNIRISLPKETTEFIDKSISFFQKQLKANLDEQIASSQNLDFLNFLNGLITKFNEVKKDYMPEVLNARNKVDGYTPLLTTITSAEATVSDIKVSLSNVNVPKEALPVYNAFTKVVDDYELYIESFKYAVKTESLTSTGGLYNKNTLDNLYTSSKDKFKTVSDSYSIFAKSFSEFQDKVPLK